ncbi:MAG: bifunctional riboflavin kinase/FAD synthetase [Bacteroidota bacterium]
MILHKDLNNLPELKNAVITIGSYDGVHAGHQEILKRLCTLAKSIDGESVLITFEPHPRLVLRPGDNSLKLISTIEEKAALLQDYGIDHLVVVPFTIAFAQQAPEIYVKEFLVKNFSPHTIVIGYDHRFGKNREGNIELLKANAQKYNYRVEETPKKEVTDIAVSSTKVREALQTGNLVTANQLLKHPFTVIGKVVKGKQRGQQIGFPTANVELGHPSKILPPDGVYAVLVRHAGKVYKGMLYIGKSLENTIKTIEVNIFDFNQSIYGDTLCIEFMYRIRGDMRFDGLEDLKVQLFKDKDQTINLLTEQN